MKLGKRTKINIDANVELKRKYIELEITSCEARLEGCQGQMFMSWHHRHKRSFYLPSDKTPLLASVNQTILVCANCHSKLEVSKQLTQDMFLRLRGPEII